MPDVLRHIATGHPRVMVVDGSKVARTLITRLLERDLPGVTVVACASGDEAVQALGDGVVDLVTTALRLPDMDGAVLAQYVRAHASQPYSPILAVSGEVADRLPNRAIGEAITVFFVKAGGYVA
ncbi:MAG: response regulator, partial [Rhodanobacteraceae bacterium]